LAGCNICPQDSKAAVVACVLRVTAAAAAYKRTEAPVHVCAHARAHCPGWQSLSSSLHLEGLQCLSQHSHSASTTGKAREAWGTGGDTGNGLAAQWDHTYSPQLHFVQVPKPIAMVAAGGATSRKTWVLHLAGLSFSYPQLSLSSSSDPAVPRPPYPPCLCSPWAPHPNYH
jgi:hypothetical protein